MLDLEGPLPIEFMDGFLTEQQARQLNQQQINTANSTVMVTVELVHRQSNQQVSTSKTVYMKSY